MINECVFSDDRAHRYLLIHRWGVKKPRERLVMWIGLNPSIADEARLDRTLTRIAGFSKREGFDGFLMANLFTLVATYPEDLRVSRSPNSPESDYWLMHAAKISPMIVAAWGAGGTFQNRHNEVLEKLASPRLHCLGKTKEGHPRHPLYVHGSQRITLWNESGAPKA